MNKLNINLNNCFGIKKLIQEFDFNDSNKVNTIYAKNGLMKTSFAKVFKKIQDGKESEIKDEIFNQEPVVKDILLDGIKIESNELFVIRSYEREYESASISSLLVNDEIKEKLADVLKLKDELFNSLEQKSGLKVSKTSLGKKVNELEIQLFTDFNLLNSSFLQNLHLFKNDISYASLQEIKYNDLFDESVVKKISKKEFQSKISDYLTKSDDVYGKFTFFKKGEFTLSKLKNIEKGLKDNSFFVSSNKIVLNGDSEFTDTNTLKSKIDEVEKELKESKEFKAIEDAFSDVKGSKLKDLIESNPTLIQELKVEKLGELRKKLWGVYFSSISEQLNDLNKKYSDLKSEISNLNIDNTTWKEAIDIFNDRFSLPFQMEIANLNSCIIGESLPKIMFKFCLNENQEESSEDDWVSLNRGELEATDTLSQGENRALYLLNIIFDIEKRKKEHKKTLFIIDDIADSFDYKNKYAIVEYLRDISLEENFYLLILSHNFDFYRTVSSRLNLDRDFRYHASKNGEEVKLIKEHFQENPFVTWKKNLSIGKEYSIIDCKKHIISLIPFIRNIIEFGIDTGVIDNFDTDYLFLTNLLHSKKETGNIDIKDLKKVFKTYIDSDNFDDSILENDKVYDIIIDLAENHISVEDIKLENKIILAIAIRLIAEKHMIDQIKLSPNNFKWKKKKKEVIGNQNDFLEFISNEKNQTRKLFDGFTQIGSKENIKILESVNIMTPENIHLNSFMYEPILDMDITELKMLYHKVKFCLSEIDNSIVESV